MVRKAMKTASVIGRRRAATPWLGRPERSAGEDGEYIKTPKREYLLRFG
jgi:hypothetical protein